VFGGLTKSDVIMKTRNRMVNQSSCQMAVNSRSHNQGADSECQPSMAFPWIDACTIATPMGLVQSRFTRIASPAEDDEIDWFGTASHR